MYANDVMVSDHAYSVGTDYSNSKVGGCGLQPHTARSRTHCPAQNGACLAWWREVGNCDHLHTEKQRHKK